MALSHRRSRLRDPDRRGGAGRHRRDPAGEPADARGLPGRALTARSAPEPAVVRVFTADDVHRLLTYPIGDRRSRERAFAHARGDRAAALVRWKRTAGTAPADAGVRSRRPRRQTRHPHPGESGTSGCRSSRRRTCCSTRRRRSLRAVIDGSSLTAIRTAAVSALATRFLAAPDARRLVIFGAGVQAHSHLDAMRCGAADRRTRRGLQDRRTPPRHWWTEPLRDGLDASVGAPEAVADADIVCTCTTSPDPVFDGSLLAEGAHVNAVGAYTLDDPGTGRGRRARTAGDRRRDARGGRWPKPATWRSRSVRRRPSASTPTCRRW